MTRSLVAFSVVALALNLSSTGCKDAPPPNVTVRPNITVPQAPTTPVTVQPAQVTVTAIPAPVVNVQMTNFCRGPSGDCDGDGLRDDGSDHCVMDPWGPDSGFMDPTRPGCRLPLVLGDASPDAQPDATADTADDAKPDGGMATDDVTPADAAPDNGQVDASADVQTTAADDAAMVAIAPPDAPTVIAPPLPPAPVAETLPARIRGTDIALAIRGGVPVDSSRMEAARQFCRVTAAMVRDAMNRASKDPCPTGTRIGCWARETANPTPNCDNNNRPFGCIQRDGQGQSQGADACVTTSANERDNLWTFQCAEGQTCTPQAVASALYPLIVPAQ